MSVTVVVRDETTTGELIHELSLELVAPRVSVRELIASRIRQEVERYNEKDAGSFHGLVQPTDTEVTLNGPRVSNRRLIDWEKQRDKAIEAFEQGQILVLVNSRQVDSLEEIIELTPETDVRFLRLVLLVGG